VLNAKYNFLYGQKLTIFLLLFCVATIYGEEKITLGLTGVTLKEDVATLINFKEYLSQKTDKDFSLKFAKNYSMIESAIASKSVDLAYVCGATYLSLNKKGEAELLALPVVEDKTTYSAYIIVHSESEFRNLFDLKQKIFAMSDPDSNSGSLIPTYELLKNGFKRDAFFKKVIYTYDHGESIEAVLSKFADGASVDSMVYNAYVKKNPDIKSRIKIINSFDDYPIPPFVVRKSLPKELKDSIKKALLEMDRDEKGRKILSSMAIDRFILPQDISYKKIEDIKNFIEAKNVE